MNTRVVCLATKTTLRRLKPYRLHSTIMAPKDGPHLSTGDPQPPVQKGLLRLYNMRFCPYAQRAVLVLDAKKVPHDIVNCNLTNKPEWLFNKSDGGKVPAIEFEDGQVLGESLLISDYLDEVYPDPPLYPADPRAKALDRLFVEKFSGAVRPFYKIVLSESYETEIFEELIKGLSVFEKELAKRGTQFFGGSSPGMLDYMIWPFIERAPMLALIGGPAFVLPKDRLPTLLAWSTRMLGHPVVKQSALPPAVHRQYLLSRKQGLYDFEFDSHL